MSGGNRSRFLFITDGRRWKLNSFRGKAGVRLCIGCSDARLSWVRRKCDYGRTYPITLPGGGLSPTAIDQALALLRLKPEIDMVTLQVHDDCAWAKNMGVAEDSYVRVVSDHSLAITRARPHCVIEPVRLVPKLGRWRISWQARPLRLINTVPMAAD
jgi:hypothetical protein